MSQPDPTGDPGQQRASDVEPDLELPRAGPRRRAPRLRGLVTAVAVGGVAGAEARYGLATALPHGPSQWPWSTLAINTSGCLLIGVLMVLITELVDAHPLIRPLLGVGFLGGYTTFSTYAVDALTLAQAGRWSLAAGYVIATPVLAVLAAAGAAAATRAVAGARHRRFRSSVYPDAERTHRPPTAKPDAPERRKGEKGRGR